ncbi:unnamed protein product [Arctogadus glacialis]
MSIVVQKYYNIVSLGCIDHEDQENPKETPQENHRRTGPHIRTLHENPTQSRRGWWEVVFTKLDEAGGELKYRDTKPVVTSINRSAPGPPRVATANVFHSQVGRTDGRSHVSPGSDLSSERRGATSPEVLLQWIRTATRWRHHPLRSRAGLTAGWAGLTAGWAVLTAGGVELRHDVIRIMDPTRKCCDKPRHHPTPIKPDSARVYMSG